MNKYWKAIGLYAMIFVLILAVLAFNSEAITAPQKEQKAYNYSNLYTELENDNIKELEITRSKEVGDFGSVEATLSDGSVININLPSVSTFQKLVDEKIADGSKIEVTTKDVQKESLLSTILPSLIMMVVMVLFFILLFNKLQGGGGKMASFGKRKAKMSVEGENKITFENVA
ncbi:ATP-dependent metallopeptidase FtsH/Yme1/Tma family protein, partial [Anaerotignum sp.]|uniref:ATP-dependent metallopeptidase FtsH/Yme1/Tma family protein n=1 Tax=Anaerotignum sp. TaxID=2039241 RepID=UPI0028A1DD5E